MFTNYSVFTYYGKDEIVRDIIHFCVDNPQNFNFGEKLTISYKRLEYGFGWVMVIVDYKNYWAMKDFALTAELVRGVENG